MVLQRARARSRNEISAVQFLRAINLVKWFISRIIIVSMFERETYVALDVLRAYEIIKRWPLGLQISLMFSRRRFTNFLAQF